MKKSMSFAAVALMALAACVTSCGPTQQEEVVATTISTDPTAVVMYVDSTVQLKATVEPTNAKVTWESEDMNTAMVDENGLVTAKAAGEVKIFAVSGTMRAATKVQVFDNPVSLQLEMMDVSQKKCTVTVTPSKEEGYYYCGYIDVETLGNATDDELREMVITNLQNTIKQYQAAGYQVTMADLLPSGKKNLIASGMTASTNYVMFAMGIDIINEKAGHIVTRLPFTTLAVKPSNMTFNIKCDSVRSTTSASGKVTIKSWFSFNPSNNTETYLLAGSKKESVEQYGDAMAYLQYMEQYYDKQYASKGGVDAVLRTGNNPVYLSPTTNGDEFIIAVAGYNGGFTTKAYSLVYKYEAAKDGKPARLVRKEVAEDSAMELNIIPMMLEEEMPTKEGNGQVLPLPIGMMHL